MSRKARVEVLEAVKGTTTSTKIIFSRKEGVYEASHKGSILTKDADGKFYYEDGKPLHAKGSKSRTIIITKRSYEKS